MPRLIDADKFKAYMQDKYILFDNTQADIDAQPTVDAELMRHGYWIEHHEPYTWMGYTYWSCSECGYECGYEKDITFRTNYCPNCGVRIDGVSQGGF